MFVPVIVLNKKKKKKKKKDPYASMGKKSKIMPQLPCYLSFLLGREGNLYISNPVNTLKRSKCTF